jgi:hypothetical protein
MLKRRHKKEGNNKNKSEPDDVVKKSAKLVMLNDSVSSTWSFNSNNRQRNSPN